MFLIITLIEIAICCLSKIKDLTIYPTENEIYTLSMDILFEHQLDLRYFCWNCSETSTANISIKNTIEYVSKQTQTQNETIRTISYNLSHFVGLSKEGNNLLIFDEQQKLSFSQPLDPQWKCNNAEFTIQGSIIMDCYIQNQLQFVFFENGILINVSKAEASIYTNKTQMITFFYNSCQNFLYLQQYIEYTVVTLFQNHEQVFSNISSFYVLNYNSSVQIGYSNNNFIYLINGMTLTQYEIQSNSIIYIFNTSFLHNIEQILVKNFNQYNSQFDTIVLVFEDAYYPVEVYLAIKNFINFYCGNLLELSNLFNYSYTIQIQMNSQYIIVQYGPYYYLASHWLIFSNPINQFIFTKFQSFDNAQIILNDFNYLFSFGSSKRKIIQIHLPQLIIFSSKVQEGTLVIQGVAKNVQQFCGVSVKYQILPQLNQDVYLEIEDFLPKPVLAFNFKWNLALENFSGPLLYLQNQFVTYSNTTQCDTNDTTIEYIANLSNSSLKNSISKIISYRFNSTQFYFLVIYEQSTIKFYYGKNLMNLSNITQYDLNYPVTNIQISIIYPNNITVGVDQDNQTIILYLFQFSPQLVFTTSNLTQTIKNANMKQFILTYQSLFILTDNNQFIIISWITYTLQTISFEDISLKFQKKFGTINYFNPQSLSFNSFQQSTQIFINNVINVFVIDIDKLNKIIPIQIINPHNISQIIQISVLNKFLVMLYSSSQQYFIQIWNINNILIPWFQKEIQLQIFDENSSIYSDELFFYTISSSNLINVYQIRLPLHKIYFYQFTAQVSQLSSTLSFITKNLMILSLGTRIATLKTFINYEVQCQTTVPNFITAFYFQFNVSSLQNKNQQKSQFQLINLLNPTTNINVKQDQTYQVSQSKITIPFQELQILKNNTILNITSESKKCKVQNIFSEPNQMSQNQFIYNSYDIVFNIGSQFFYQNGKIIVDNNNFAFSLLQNYSKCITTSVFESTVSTICQINSLEYQLLGYQYQNNSFNFISYANLTNYQPKSLFQYKLLMFITQEYIVGHHYVIPFYLNYTYLNSIYSICRANDFVGIQLQQIEDTDIVLIFGICSNLINYQLINYTSSPLKVNFWAGKSNILILEKFIQGYFEYQSLVALKSQSKLILILLTTKNTGSYLVELLYNIRENILEVQSLIKIIPPYNNFDQTNYVFCQNPFIFLAFTTQLNDRSVFALYNYENLSNFETPLTMLGGYEVNFFPSSLSFYINQLQIGQISYIEQVQGDGATKIYSQNITQAMINCSFRNSIIRMEKSFKVDFNLANSFDQQLNQITFQHISSLFYEKIILLSILVIVILIFIFYFCFNCLKNKGKEENEQNDEESEFEL